MEKNPVQSIDRVFDIIETLAEVPRGMALTEISELVGLHKSTVHRMLASLITRGYVAKEPESGKYRLTMRLFETGSRVVGGLNILSVARPYLEHLFDLTDEAIHLVVRDGIEIVYLYKEDSSNSTVRMASRVGLRNPMYCTAVGKSIMAALPEEEARELWEKSAITPFTPKTIITFARMKDEMALTRERGFAVDDEEHESGVRCIGVAIRDYSGKPVAAVSISAPAARLSDERMAEIAPHIISCAENISHLLGYKNI